MVENPYLSIRSQWVGVVMEQDSWRHFNVFRVKVHSILLPTCGEMRTRIRPLSAITRKQLVRLASA